MSLSKRIDSLAQQRIYNQIDSIPPAYTAIVLGASVYADGNLSTMLRDRVEGALQLYERKKVQRILLSGDNATSQYNEPKAMRKYLVERGVPKEHIYMDFAGFDTFDSMYRAKAIFEVDNAIVVTQGFHLPRAIYIAEKLGLNYYGYLADQRIYEHIKSNKQRELLANVKAYLELIFEQKPTFLGKRIPITGPPQETF